MIIRLKAIQSTPTCRFDRHQLVDSINTLVSCWWTTTFRQQRPNIKLTFREEHCGNSHLQVFNLKTTSKTVEHEAVSWESHMQIEIRTTLEPSTLCFHWKYLFPCNFKFLCWPGPPRPSDWPCLRLEQPVHRHCPASHGVFFNTIIK